MNPWGLLLELTWFLIDLWTISPIYTKLAGITPRTAGSHRRPAAGTP